MKRKPKRTSADSSTPYTGALSQKRRPELVEIAQALELDASAKMADLVKSIQSHLDTNEDTLSKSPMFKGLYSRRRKWARPTQGNGVVLTTATLRAMPKRHLPSIGL